MAEALRAIARGLSARAMELSRIEDGPPTTGSITVGPSAPVAVAEDLRRLFEPHLLGAPQRLAAPAQPKEPLARPKSIVVLSRRG